VLSKRLAFIAVLFLSAAAFAEEPGVNVSTQPLGSPFYRHLAFDFGLDIHDVAKLERRGFGRGETVTLVLISKATGVSFKEYAKRRLKDQVSLKDLAAEAKLDYPTLLKSVRTIKEGIESKGDQNLPPPVFEPSPTPEPRRRRKEKNAPSPSPSPTPSVSPSPSPVAAPTPAPAQTPAR
jgi:hypothetical protein